MTFSIVARDETDGSIGVAAQSHFFALGPLVCWAEAGVGAVATQSFVDTTYGPVGLDLMRLGKTAHEALEMIRASDSDPAVHQVGLIDAMGEPAHFTGDRCIPHAGSVGTHGVAAQGNMLASPDIPEAMVAAYLDASGSLAQRLLHALRAAQSLGGDARGSQSAALKVVAAERAARPWDAVVVDLRADDHARPIDEIERLLDIRGAFDLLGEVLFADGLMQGGGFHEPESGSLEAALKDLEQADMVLSPNPEARFWRAVLLSRAGREVEAAADFQKAYEMNPDLEEFRDQVARAGFMDP